MFVCWTIPLQDDTPVCHDCLVVNGTSTFIIIYVHGTAARVLTSGHPPETRTKSIHVWSLARAPEQSFFELSQEKINSVSEWLPESKVFRASIPFNWMCSTPSSTSTARSFPQRNVYRPKKRHIPLYDAEEHNSFPIEILLQNYFELKSSIIGNLHTC